MPLGAQIVFRLPQDLDQALRDLAEFNGRSVASEIRRAVDAHLESELRRQRIEAMTDEELDAALLGIDRFAESDERHPRQGAAAESDDRPVRQAPG